MADRAVRLDALRRLYEQIGRVNGGRSLTTTLQAVVDGVVEGLGFGVAAVNLVHADGTFETVAVAGSDEARAALVGSRAPADAFDLEFKVAEQWGALRFVPHDRLPPEEITGWVPDPQVLPKQRPGQAADAWHPLDALFAPLHSPAGALVGMLSVDLPHDGRRPGALQRELLEMFATQAGIAIDNARLTEHLHASEEAFRLAFEGAGIGMSMINLDPADPGRFLRVNDAMCAITGYTVDELTSRTFADVTHPDDVDHDTEAFARIVSGSQQVHRAEKRYVRPDGGTVWVSITTSCVRLESGEALYAISQVEDITTRRAAEAELSRRATHDPLTGLWNRGMLTERLTRTLADVRTNGGVGAVLFCDLDGFKAVNDTHGHDVGDQVLSIVAARLVEEVRDGDDVFRLGGDEFVVLAHDTTLASAERLAERVERSLAAPIHTRGTAVALTVSIGIAPVTPRAADANSLVHHADTAMYQAKAAGRNGHAILDAAGAPPDAPKPDRQSSTAGIG